MQNGTFHTHTTGFDGENSVYEMAQKAKDLGFESMGISNHFIVHPRIKEASFYRHSIIRDYYYIYNDSFADCIEMFRKNYAEIEKISQELNFPIYKGMEVDFFEYDGWRENFEKAIKELKPDYLIGSSHFVEHKGVLINNYEMAIAPKEEHDEILYAYWHNVRQSAKSRMFDWLAHIDLPRKSGLLKEEKWKGEEEKTLSCIAENGGKIEINTGLYKPECYEPYPSPRILKMLPKYNIPVIISDDSHNVSQIGRHFEEAENLAKECGITSFFSIE